MSEDWFYASYINGKVFLHGTKKDQSTVEIVLEDDDQKEFEDLSFKHEISIQNFLRLIAERG